MKFQYFIENTQTYLYFNDIFIDRVIFEFINQLVDK